MAALKRSLAAEPVLGSSNWEVCQLTAAIRTTSTHKRHQSAGSRSRTFFIGRSMPMQTTAARSFADSMPSFMSVFGNEDSELKNDAYNGHALQSPTAIDHSFAAFHLHRDSLSTSASGSTDSSPTTVASLIESSSLAETPNTSPDTPASLQSYTYPSMSLAMRNGTDGTQLRPPTAPPSKKPRNLKNLAVNTSGTMSAGRGLGTAALPADQSSDTSSLPSPQPPQQRQSTMPAAGPMSPSFVKPKGPPQRKATALGLTIKTPATENFSIPQIASIVPPTPGHARPAALRHFQSSPSLPALAMAQIKGPQPGIGMPPKQKVNVSFAEIPIEKVEEEPPQNFDVPQSKEEQPETYPDGPICIYDPHVYLYFEPTAEQASDYDVIFNVASEVKNPFTGKNAIETKAEQIGTHLDDLPECGALCPASGPSELDADGKKQPEYIHIPWEHNTDIVPDLHKLVKVIDNRVEQGKRVLIHCQCGVSRSASLIVAYGLYKNGSISVQDAYDAVKRRSKWIGPNMNLIMQLQEFRSGLHRSVSNSTLGARSIHGRSATESHCMRKSDSSEQQVPQTAPLQPDSNGKLVPTAIQTQGLEKVSPGPSSAPSDYHWPSSALNSEAPTPVLNTKPSKSDTQYVSATGQVVQPMQQEIVTAPERVVTVAPPNGVTPRKEAPRPLVIAKPSPQPMCVESPRSAEFAMTPVNHTNIEHMFGLTSPRAATFASTPQSPEPLASPRSTEFGMSPVQPRDVDEMFGLSSPRQATFASSPMSTFSFEPPSPQSPLSPQSFTTAFNSPQQLTFDDSFAINSPRSATFQIPGAFPQSPTSPSPHDQFVPRVRPVLPPVDLESTPDKQARAELRSHLGLTSRTSNYDMRSAFAAGEVASGPLLAQPHAPAETTVSPSVERDTVPEEPEFEDALMSPRATEFTSNPFADALAAGPPAEYRQSNSRQGSPRPDEGQFASASEQGAATTAVATDDPRSPAQHGIQPIVRNIFDVF